jgi:antitoxin (DNA-binding transcriptional repressor) of toxin-antitoxin stability system
VQKVYEGEEVLICKAGKPMAKLVKYEPSKIKRKAGILKGQIELPMISMNCHKSF